MTLEDFEHDVREIIEHILNRLQAANLLAAQVSSQAEAEIQGAGQLVQQLVLLVEEFVTQQGLGRW
jgi:hypothetical protein